MVAVSQLFRNFAPANFNKTIKEEWLTATIGRAHV